MNKLAHPPQSSAQADQPSSARVTKTLFLSGDSVAEKRAELRRYFQETFDLYESLFSLITDNSAYYLRAEPLRHPLIFYFGHTATFFINKLFLAKLITQRINPSFESMFAVGVDEMSWDDLNTDHYAWPSVADVQQYRDRVRETVMRIIDNMPLSLPITQDAPGWVILMGIEHERIHLETSSVIMRMLPLCAMRSDAPEWQASNNFSAAPKNQLLPIQAKTITLGKPLTDDTYGWDNEYGEKSVSIEAFKVSQYLVSNEEYLGFVTAGGYQTPKYWDEEGQRWLAYTQAEMPKFWRFKERAYWQRNLTQEIPLPLSWPVEVNYLEAKAFCNWKSEQTGTHIRLPTEPEWYRLRDTLETDQPYWRSAPGNINLEYFASSCPVNQYAFSVEAQKIYDLIGNVWQWTESPIDALPGFQVHPLYDDFSTPTFDGKHNLIKGGSWISTGNEAIRSSRYAFRRHFFQHAGFRYIESSRAEIPLEPMNLYETDPLVSQHLEFHYGDRYFNVPNFAEQCVDRFLQIAQPKQRQRALDIGCAVGRASFELAKQFDHVDGIDFSARFIQSACRLQEQGTIRYTIPAEGALSHHLERSLADLDLATHANNILFSQGDATNLKAQFDQYDVALALNLIEQLNNPALFLSAIGARIKPGGWLALTSTYAWQAALTPEAQWLGGKKIDGESLTTLEGLKMHLTPTFELVGVEDIPFILRETDRTFQHAVAEMSIWVKRG